jgi:hypothetical protein
VRLLLWPLSPQIKTNTNSDKGLRWEKLCIGVNWAERKLDERSVYPELRRGLEEKAVVAGLWALTFEKMETKAKS